MLGKKKVTTTVKTPKKTKKGNLEPSFHPDVDLKKKDVSAYSLLDVEDEKRVERALAIVHPLVMDEIDVTEVSKMTEEELITHVRPIIGRILNMQRIQLNAKEQSYMEQRLADDMIGLGPLEYLLSDDTISDILVNSTDSVYIERYGKLSRSHISFRNENHILNVISRIVSIIGRRIDETNPYVDARLKDGSRVNAIIPPLAIDGPCISIRKFRRQTMTLDTMVDNNTLSATMAKFLSIAVRCRLNIIILGGAGSGKTTLLNALSLFVPETERVITIEDSAELQLQQPHVIRLETRPANIEGKGAVTERILVRNCLRMRPDRIILGEIRGEEAFDLLQAMNTGHDGSMSTIHASSTKEVPARLSNMVLMAGYRFPSEAIIKQIADSVHLLVQTNRMHDGHRRITNIAEITGFERDNLTLQSLFSYEVVGENEQGLVGKFKCSSVVPNFLSLAKLYNLQKELEDVLCLPQS